MSSRRNHDDEGKQLSAQSAGATGGRDHGIGIDAQSFIDAYTMQVCDMCDGEGTVSDEGLRTGWPHTVICPACEGSGYSDG